MFNRQFPYGSVISFDYDGSGNAHHYFSPLVSKEWDFDVHPLINMARNRMHFPDPIQWQELLNQIGYGNWDEVRDQWDD